MRLEVTRKSDLALRVLGVLADGRRAKASDLADVIGSTPGFVAQVIAPLIKSGWVRSVPGPSGGYVLAVDGREISVLQVIEAVEGTTASGWCVLSDQPCEERGTCVLHGPWSRARASLMEELDQISVAAVLAHGAST